MKISLSLNIKKSVNNCCYIPQPTNISKLHIARMELYRKSLLFIFQDFILLHFFFSNSPFSLYNKHHSSPLSPSNVQNFFSTTRFKWCKRILSNSFHNAKWSVFMMKNHKTQKLIIKHHKEKPMPCPFSVYLHVQFLGVHA